MPSADLPYRPCVGILVINREGRVWIGRRAGASSRPEGPDHWWQMPQGGIDEGEDAWAAAQRELYEETGMRTIAKLAESRTWHTYDLPPELVGKAWGGRFRGQKQKWFAVRLDGPDSEIDIVPADGHEVEFEAWRWASPAELTNLVVPFKREVYTKVLAEFGPVIGPAPATNS